MKTTIAAATAIALLASSAAFAQGVGVQVGTTGVGVGLSFAPEQRTHIREYVVKEKVAPVTLKEKIVVGHKLPADVELRTVPADWGPSVSKYRYIYSDNHVYFVEPSTREVVSVID